MIFIKTAEEIELMRESNLLVSTTLAELAQHIKQVERIKAGLVSPAEAEASHSEPQMTSSLTWRRILANSA